MTEHARRPLLAPKGARQAELFARAKKAVLEGTTWLSAEDLSNKIGCPRGQLETWRPENRIFAIQVQGENLYPGYGFNEQGCPRPEMKPIIDVLSKERDGWRMAFWFKSANGYLDGPSPRESLVKQSEKVLQAAVYEVDDFCNG